MTPCLKLGDVSLPVGKIKRSRLVYKTLVILPCRPPSMLHAPHTLFLLYVRLTDLLAPLTQQVPSHFSAYNSFLLLRIY